MLVSAMAFSFCMTAVSGSALAAGPATALETKGSLSDAAMDKELLVLENRFFFHSYAHDPFEKRLERIELLALGNVQYGTNGDRLMRLKAAITERDKEAAKQIAAQTKPGGSGNYPAINTLEWRILKKTYTAETIDQRLDRLEKSIFGVPAQAMSYVDRIDRLKKTVGIGLPSPTPLAGGGAFKRGPMPRSGGMGGTFGNDNGDAQEEFTFPNGFGSGEPEVGQLRPFTPLPRNPFLSPNGRSIMISPFASPNLGSGTEGSGGPVGLSELMDRMHKHMIDVMKQFSSGTIFEEPDFDSGLQPIPGSPGAGGSGGGGPSLGPQIQPLPQPQSQSVPKIKAKPGFPRRVTPREELPPYSDPNSI